MSEWTRKHKQGGMVVPLAMGLLKRHKFNIISSNIEDDEEETLPPFIVVQLENERLETYVFIVSSLRSRW